ncbi:hypothetical protein PoB_002067000 [Plakobranchus ocellatus]|uniref:Uncharacterized protein n=1 Tax=Plakobranchus ocellatus TaxID=259542 RepID=A0AAV3ZHV0_9GAST|nr:hypothetical protein PoB_002067000 [Plakobranchus ocellatus]
MMHSKTRRRSFSFDTTNLEERLFLVMRKQGPRSQLVQSNKGVRKVRVMKHIARYSRRRERNLRKIMRPRVLIVPTLLCCLPKQACNEALASYDKVVPRFKCVSVGPLANLTD